MTTLEMASNILTHPGQTAKDMTTGGGGGGGGGGDAKIQDLAKDTVSYHKKDHRLTADYGPRQSNTDAWLKVVSQEHEGPMLLEDQFAREKIHRFDHERIPERVVHARGSGAFGKFKLLESASDVTNAGVLTDTSRETPVYIRFSTVLGSSGSADTVRDVRGFAVKFYTQEGNWDIVGNDIRELPLNMIQSQYIYIYIANLILQRCSLSKMPSRYEPSRKEA
jgi:catalase